MSPHTSHTIRNITQRINKALRPVYPAEECTEIVRLLLEEVTGLSRAQLLASPLHPLTENEEKNLTEALYRLQHHEPIQYILGKTWFYGFPLTVNQNVLIPRPETEELVTRAMQEFTKSHALPPFVLDAGTGSGCIAIAIKSLYPPMKIAAFDVSEAALEVARVNAASNGAGIHFFRDDIVAFSGLPLSEKLGFLISNPPYIMEKEKEQMRPNVVKFEPGSALFVSDNDPLIYYRGLKAIAKKWVISGGFLFFEINESLEKEMHTLFNEPNFYDIAVEKDMRGKPRFLRCRKA